MNNNIMSGPGSSNGGNWAAPGKLSTCHPWHVGRVGGKWQAGHFALTGHGDPLDFRVNVLPQGRTAGRALRAFRRKLQRCPVAY